DHPGRILGIDPKIVVVAVTRRHLVESRASVGRLPHLQVGDVDRVAVARVGEDVGVVPGPVHQVAVGRHHGPAHAEIVGAVEPGLVAFGFDQRPDAARPRRRDRHADLAQHARGQGGLGRNLLPGVAAVRAAEQAAARTAAGNVPEVALGLPHRGEQQARVVRIHGEVDRARDVAAVEDPFPGRAAILRAVDTALAVWSENIAQYRDIDEVGILRMDADAADALAVLQADVLPAASGIGRLVDAVAVGDVEADRGLAGAGIDHVGIGGRHGDRAHCRGAHEAVRHAAPEDAAILGLPDAAGAGAEIEHHLVDGIARDGDDATATRGTNAAPLERVETRRRGQALFRCHVREGRSLQVMPDLTVSQVCRVTQSALATGWLGRRALPRAFQVDMALAVLARTGTILADGDQPADRYSAGLPEAGVHVGRARAPLAVSRGAARTDRPPPGGHRSVRHRGATAAEGGPPDRGWGGQAAAQSQGRCRPAATPHHADFLYRRGTRVC